MRILLIEDDQKIASFIQKGLREAGFVVGHAADGETGLHLALNESFDAAIIDIMLPQRDGLSVIEGLRKSRRPLPVLILSAKRSVDDRIRGLSIGGDDYLTKPFAFSELLARVQALLRRASGAPEPMTLSYGDLAMNLIAREVTRAGRKIDLQPREFALLEYLLRNSEKVVTRTMIMEHVWNYNFDPETNVVEARICRLREKVDEGFSPKLIHTIRGAGYVLRSHA
jgi:two-component system OmpR family response regulator